MRKHRFFLLFISALAVIFEVSHLVGAVIVKMNRACCPALARSNDCFAGFTFQSGGASNVNVPAEWMRDAVISTSTDRELPGVITTTSERKRRETGGITSTRRRTGLPHESVVTCTGSS